MRYEHTWAVFETFDVDDDEIINECHSFDSEHEAMAYVRTRMTPQNRFEADMQDSMDLDKKSVYSLFVVETEWTFDDTNTVIDAKKIKTPFYLDWGWNDEMELWND